MSAFVGYTCILLFEQVFELAEDTVAVGLAGLYAGGAAQAFEDSLLLVGELLGHVDHDVDEFVAAASVLVVGPAGMLRRARPPMVGTSTEPPRTAVGMSSIRLYITSAPSRMSSGCLISSTTTSRSPGTPPPLG